MPAVFAVVVCVVAPVFQLYDAKPAPAFKVAVVPAQISPLPVMLTVGAGLTVTVVLATALQPAALVTVTV